MKKVFEICDLLQPAARLAGAIGFAVSIIGAFIGERWLTAAGVIVFVTALPFTMPDFGYLAMVEGNGND